MLELDRAYLEDSIYLTLTCVSLDRKIGRPPCCLKEPLTGLLVPSQPVVWLFTLPLSITTSLLAIDLPVLFPIMAADALNRPAHVV